MSSNVVIIYINLDPFYKFLSKLKIVPPFISHGSAIGILIFNFLKTTLCILVCQHADRPFTALSSLWYVSSPLMLVSILCSAAIFLIYLFLSAALFKLVNGM